MLTLDVQDMCDLMPLSPACVAQDAVLNLGGVAAGGVFGAIGDAFAQAAASVMDAVFEAISTTTSVDLSASYVTDNAAMLGSVALVVVVGLFVTQVTAAAIRREPGGLGRAVTGAGLAVLGTAAAAAVVQALLIAVDQVCAWIAALAGTSIEDAARDLLDISALLQVGLGGGGAALMILFGLLYIVGAVLTLGTLLVRQALIVVAVVLAPLAIAGGAARITSGWVVRWVQVVLALILSKLAIVVVFVVAVGMVGSFSGLGAVLSGLILLMLASLAPWATFKVLDFAGTHAASDWHKGTNGSTLAVANQGRYAASNLMRSVTMVVGSGGAAAAAAPAAAGGAAASRAPSGSAPIPVLGRAWSTPSSSRSTSVPSTAPAAPAGSPTPAPAPRPVPSTPPSSSSGRSA